MFLFKMWQLAIEKYQIKPNHYLAGAISMVIVLVPMMAAFVLSALTYLNSFNKALKC